MALTAYYSAGWFDSILDSASWLKAWLSNDWLPLEINVWFKFLLKDEALVLMFFTMLARIVLYALFGVFNMITASFRTPALSRGEVRALLDDNKRLKYELEDAVRAKAAEGVRAAATVSKAAGETLGNIG